MPFRHHGSDDDQPAAAPAPPPMPDDSPIAPAAQPNVTAASYAAGSTEGLTENARARLEQNRAGLFTSDLTVNEFVMIDEAGFEPLGMVMGSSVYHIGFQTTGYRQSQELAVLTQAMYSARQLAMTRMEEEADQLGADGVVGVRITIQMYEWGADLAEFNAIGTAVKHREGVLHRAPNGRPFTSALTGQQFSTLIQFGHRPVGMVMGNCVYHIAHQSMRQAMRNVGQNVEMELFTQALYNSRELAVQRMQVEAQSLQARGIVGVRINQGSFVWGGHVIEFFSLGTAVVRAEQPPTRPEPSYMLDLGH
ncbi:MAG: heavy metal-binding domain-containing protein [Solirubrobacteraceae bacterium]